MKWENCDEPENIEFEGNDIFLSHVHWVLLNLPLENIFGSSDPFKRNEVSWIRLASIPKNREGHQEKT